MSRTRGLVCTINYTVSNYGLVCTGFLSFYFSSFFPLSTRNAPRYALSRAQDLSSPGQKEMPSCSLVLVSACMYMIQIYPGRSYNATSAGTSSLLSADAEGPETVRAWRENSAVQKHDFSERLQCRGETKRRCSRKEITSWMRTERIEN